MTENQPQLDAATSDTSPPATGIARIPAPALFVSSAVVQYVGAGLAVGLFAVMGPGTVAWLRTLVAAVVLIAWRRPWRQRWTRRSLGMAALFGLVLVAMNTTFYFAIDYLPLGTAVAIEFLGPISVAAIGGRGARQRVALVLAAAGVLLISGFGLEWNDGTAIGLAWILGAAVAWAGYILLGRKVATGHDGMTTLSVGLAFATVIYGFGFAWGSGPAFGSWGTAASAIGVGVFSSAIPYAIDQLNMKRLQAASFALLSALLPATAAVIGCVMLGQWPNLAELVGLAAVSVAVVLSSRR